jgi:S1-C subfamily serine protease
MKHILASILVAVMSIGCSISCSSSTRIKPKEPSSLVSHVSDATVALVYTKVEKADENDDSSPNILTVRPFCTGVFIDKYRILTANHCVEGLAEHEGEEVDGMKIHYIVGREVDAPEKEPYAVHLAREIAVDTDHDLALIVAMGPGDAIPNHSIAKLADQSPGLGEDLLFVGHPHGLYFTVLHGSVAQYVKEIEGVMKIGPFLQVEAPVWFGNSGGGAFDADGNLVGICSFTSGVPSSAFYIHLNSIRTFVDAQK